MKTLFADAGYWISLLHRHDELHERAKRVSASLGPVKLVTSEMVLTEFLNYFAGRGKGLREMAAAWVEKLLRDPNTLIVPQTSTRFRTDPVCQSKR